MSLSKPKLCPGCYVDPQDAKKSALFDRCLDLYDRTGRIEALSMASEVSNMRRYKGTDQELDWEFCPNCKPGLESDNREPASVPLLDPPIGRITRTCPECKGAVSLPFPYPGTGILKAWEYCSKCGSVFEPSARRRHEKHTAD
jgi:hypothetical protein